MTSQPLVSIVTPVYNGGAFLRDCVESVLGQTYRNLDYVIVDNASEDDTPRIAAEYANRDSRVRVVTNDTLCPPVENHNKAMSLIAPNAVFCKSLMADDWLYPDAVERMVTAGMNHPSVGVICGMGFNGRYVLWDGWPYPAACVPARDVCAATLRRALYVFGNSSTQMFRADLVRKRSPLFREDTLHEDVEVCFDLLQESDFAFVHQIVAFCREHAGSISAEIGDLGTIEAANLSFLLRYGPAYLGVDEFWTQRERAIDDYFRFLARAGWKRISSSFWDFHLRNLGNLGIPMSKRRLAKAFAHEALHWASNAERWTPTWRGVWKRLRSGSKSLRKDVADSLHNRADRE